MDLSSSSLTIGLLFGLDKVSRRHFSLILPSVAIAIAIEKHGRDLSPGPCRRMDSMTGDLQENGWDACMSCLPCRTLMATGQTQESAKQTIDWYSSGGGGPFPNMHQLDDDFSPFDVGCRPLSHVGMHESTQLEIFFCIAPAPSGHLQLISLIYTFLGCEQTQLRSQRTDTHSQRAQRWGTTPHTFSCRADNKRDNGFFQLLSAFFILV
ncbi:MAG: hypothetical protein J3Q66DRAFT_149235 [Benniella sp.]|nr:MAG: hypothetical protein J3Q66DRAFT_149235 [Benniella sp.]